MLNVILKYLNLNNYTHFENDFKDLFLSHPNYPSLYAVTDSFDFLKIENVAAIVPKDKFIELPRNFLTFFENEFVLVSKQDDYVAVETNQLKKNIFKSEDFIEIWDGLVVGIETNGNKTSFLHINHGSKWLIYGILSMLPFVLLLFLKDFDVYSFLSIISIILGLFVSLLIINESFFNIGGFKSNICNFNSSVSCEKVIISSHSKINNWLSFVDLPIIFFGSCLMSMLISIETASFIGFVSLFSIPLII